METRTRNYGFVKELLQTRVVMMEANALQNYRATLLRNLNAHTASAEIEAALPAKERHSMIVYGKHDGAFHKFQFINENNVLCEETPGGDEQPAQQLDAEEERVLVLEMCGPVTRYGGMCSYSSKDFRDLLTEYASDEKTVGMVLVTDTPGGTSFAMHDFAQGMKVWNEAGKRSIQFIDGDSLSAGVALGSQCQRVIAMSRMDSVGCIGAMMAGWATADGTLDSDGNRFVDVTATQTPDKNAEYRQASVGDYKGVQADVDKCAEDFLNLLSDVRPQITDEQKTGKIYLAGDVIGTLVDGIGDFQAALTYARTGEEIWETGTGEPKADDGEVPAQDEPAEDAPAEDTPADGQDGDEQNPEADGEDKPAEDEPANIGRLPEANPDDSPLDEPAEQSQMASMLARIEALDHAMQEQSQRTQSRIGELEREATQLRQRNQELQDSLRQSRAELNALQTEAPAPAMPSAASKREVKTEAPAVRISDTMSNAEKLKAWKQREKQLAAIRRG